MRLSPLTCPLMSYWVERDLCDDQPSQESETSTGFDVMTRSQAESTEENQEERENLDILPFWTEETIPQHDSEQTSKDSRGNSSDTHDENFQQTTHETEEAM